MEGNNITDSERLDIWWEFYEILLRLMENLHHSIETGSLLWRIYIWYVYILGIPLHKSN